MSGKRRLAALAGVTVFAWWERVRRATGSSVAGGGGVGGGWRERVRWAMGSATLGGDCLPECPFGVGIL